MENGRAQVLPAFNTSITDPANYFALTTEQKQYRYLISGQDESGRYTSDNHLMYGGEATAEQFVDVPLGGDRNPPYFEKKDDGTLETHWEDVLLESGQDEYEDDIINQNG